MTGPGATWHEHVLAAQQGELPAFDALVRQFEDMAVGYAYTLLGDFASAEDAAQDAFVQAYLDLKTLREPYAFPAWLRRLVFKHCDRITRRKRLPTVPLEGLEAPAPEPGPEEAVQQREAQRAVLGAVQALPENERVATTLFYINGYSLADVGQFLEVPTSTVKNRLHSARSRLRERMMEMVAETLKQHAPDEEFGKRIRKVVEGIREVAWESIWLTYEGSAYACLKALVPEVTLPEMMGLCGGAFRFFWHPEAGPWMCNYLLIGEEAARRTFAPFGYAYTYLADYDHAETANEERYRQLIVESIDAGRPVVGLGVVGPPREKNPEPCIVTGYDRGGAVFYGRSYFQAFGGDYETTESGYFRVEDWYPRCYGVIVPGAKRRRPARRKVLRDALAWAVELAHTPSVRPVEAVRGVDKPGGPELLCGLAAYDPLADEFLNEARFIDNPEDDIWARWAKVELMMFNGIWLLHATRSRAAEFLASAAREDLPGAEHLAHAAASYAEEVAGLYRATEHIPLEASEQHCVTIARPEVRLALRRIVVEAKAHEVAAVGHLERALAEM
jgi:RNA polymerase sigma factor (sigma-70 family)